MRVKILDAWSWGIPIVSTTIGAEGLESEHGGNLLLADEANTFAEAVIRILQNQSFADNLVAAGRKTINETYDWHRIYPAWEAVFATGA